MFSDCDMNQFEDVKKYIIVYLIQNLPENLYYHNADHTLDVLNAVTSLAIAENITDAEETLLIKTAALFHDTGHVITYTDHEEASCRFAELILPGYGYSAEQIARIRSLILKTKMPQSPSDHLDKILCDADLDYLGRADYREISDRLFKEWKTLGKIKSRKDWYYVQKTFLATHQYWTETSRLIRQPAKEKHLAVLKQQAI